MNDEPLLSILMTAFNREQYITEAIESVLNSSYKNFELIIVDDSSEDLTCAIIEKYASLDSRIRFYRNEFNLGDYRNRNKASSYAKGEYIMFVDSDDMILIDGFQRCIDAMKLHPEASFGMRLSLTGKSPFYKGPEECIREHFFRSPCLMMGPGGTIMRRIFFEDIGRYPVKYGPANDMYFNLKAASVAGVLFLPFVFNFYRIHEGQEINNKYSYLHNGYNYLNDALLKLSLPLTVNEVELLAKKNKRLFIMNLLKFYIKTFDYTKTRNAIKLAGFTLSDFLNAVNYL
jgi:glycosyltransferase involved in cell wall biosynthesis